MTSSLNVSVVVEVRFSCLKRTSGTGADWSASGLGMRNWISDGGPTDHELQRMFSLSQSMKPSLGDEGLAAMMGTDACGCEQRV